MRLTMEERKSVREVPPRFNGHMGSSRIRRKEATLAWYREGMTKSSKGMP